MTHELVGNEVVATADGVEATCTCGWKSGPRFSGMVASALFRDHAEGKGQPEKDLYDVARRISHEMGYDYTDPRTGEKTPAPDFKPGDYVVKRGGDYYFEGWVIMVGTKRSGVIRVGVENREGLIHIFNPNQLVKVPERNE